MDSELDSNNDDLGSNFSNNSGSKRQKRGILPKHATSVMRAWLFQHLVVSKIYIFLNRISVFINKKTGFIRVIILRSICHPIL